MTKQKKIQLEINESFLKVDNIKKFLAFMCEFDEVKRRMQQEITKELNKIDRLQKRRYVLRTKGYF